MNKNLLSLAVLIAIALIALGASGCGRTADTNGNSHTTNKNSGPEPVNPATIEAELTKLERDWAAAFRNKDAATIRRILADDIVLTYPDGATGTKNDEVQLAESGAFSADSWEMVDSKVTVIDAEAAFITGRTVVKNGKLKDPRTQQIINISGEYRFLDVYAKRNGNWQAIASQVTPIRKQ